MKAFEKNYFFLHEGMQKKEGFDSYSKTIYDIVNFYHRKYPELAPEYKFTHHLTDEQMLSVLDKEQVQCVDINYITKPFECYIFAFLFAMNKDYDVAIDLFNKSIDGLDSSFSSKVNKIFIRLQLAVLYEMNKDLKTSLKILISTYKEISKNEKLMNEIHNFLASCCVSIGLLYNKMYKNNNIAGLFFNKSIILRIRHRHTYPFLIFENYLSTVLRYKAVIYSSSVDDKYYYLNESYNMRLFISENTKDEYSKKELIFTASDLLNLLIINNSSSKKIEKVSRKMYNAIFTLSNDTMKHNVKHIFSSCMMMSKYYYIKCNYKIILFGMLYQLS